jgi:iron complex transport system permease protein
MTAADRLVDLPPRGSATLMLAAAGLFLFAAILSMGTGATGIGLDAVWKVAVRTLSSYPANGPDVEHLVIMGVRLPRTILGAFVGASLAVAGAMMQGLFRNPLADPGVIGVSSGAALAAVATIALGNGIAAPITRSFGAYALPVAAFFGGLLTTSLLVLVARRSGEILVGTLLLSGIAVAALAEAMTGLISYASDDRELRDLTLWRLGSLSGASWPKVLGILPFGAVLILILPRVVRALNGMLLGEAEAFHLGIDLGRAKRTVIFATAVAVGASVAVAGVIGFVGIVVPHLVRLIAGPDHRFLLPASAMLGASLVLLADVLARLLVRPAELPLGIVLAVIGAPVFLHLVLNKRTGIST